MKNYSLRITLPDFYTEMNTVIYTDLFRMYECAVCVILTEVLSRFPGEEKQTETRIGPLCFNQWEIPKIQYYYNT